MYALEITREKDNSFAGEISSLTADVPFTAVPNKTKKQDNQPDYLIYARSPRGKAIEIGAIWEKVGKESDKPYLLVNFRINGKAVSANAFDVEGSDDLNVILSDDNT